MVRLKGRSCRGVLSLAPPRSSTSRCKACSFGWSANPLASPIPPPPPPPPPSGTIRVPEDYATIQEAVNAAGDGDTVLVGPGTYAGGIVISGKSITLASYYHTSGDTSFIDQTIINGGSPGIYVDAP